MLLLRGINLGPNRRISMPELRARLAEHGYTDASTLLQSGNVVLSAPSEGAELEREFAAHLRSWFGLDVPVVARSAAEMEAVVEGDPLGDVAQDPKRYQVSFLSSQPPAGLAGRLAELAAEGERVEVVGREIYAWHPDGVARSRLWNRLAGTGLGVTATSRNWSTVCKLAELARA